jgi:hypothetical protein
MRKPYVLVQDYFATDGRVRVVTLALLMKGTAQWPARSHTHLETVAARLRPTSRAALAGDEPETGPWAISGPSVPTCMPNYRIMTLAIPTFSITPVPDEAVDGGGTAASKRCLVASPA